MWPVRKLVGSRAAKVIEALVCGPSCAMRAEWKNSGHCGLQRGLSQAIIRSDAAITPAPDIIDDRPDDSCDKIVVTLFLFQFSNRIRDSGRRRQTVPGPAGKHDCLHHLR